LLGDSLDIESNYRKSFVEARACAQVFCHMRGVILLLPPDVRLVPTGRELGA